jgi:pimeloyl-ACP methyl ester carboxylesterase
MAEVWNHQHAEVNGVKLHYVRQGQGEPLFLIHGWPGFWFEWNKNIGPLSEQFDVIAPDMRGFAYSDKPDLPPAQGYSDEAFAGDIAALIAELGFDRVNIVAHDFGAVWTQHLARTRSELVKKLVLFDPPYPGIGGRWFEMPQPLESWYMLFHQQPWAEDVVGSSRAATETYLRHFLRHWSHDTDVFPDDEIEEFVEAYSQPGALRGGFNCYRAVFQGGSGGGGDTKIDVPTLILWGDSDPIIKFEWSDNLEQSFSSYELKKVEGAGHFMHREMPDRVNQEIRDFLSA